jgi:hypothetical protein
LLVREEARFLRLSGTLPAVETAAWVPVLMVGGVVASTMVTEALVGGRDPALSVLVPGRPAAH